MAHEIETHGGQAAAVFAREDAWHRLGTTLPETFTAEEAMLHGHLGGWDVRKIPLVGHEVTESGVTEVEVPDRYATVRNNPFEAGQVDYLGVVGGSYTPVQNEAHAELLNTLVHDSGAIFDTAGSLRGGREVFITMKLPDHIVKIGEVDPVESHLVALNSHDGSSAFRLMLTPVRVVCANTVAAALRHNDGVYSIRHTTNVMRMIEDARQSLGLAIAYAEEFEAEAEKMIQETLTEGEFRKIIEAAYGGSPGDTDRQKKNTEEFLSGLTSLFTSSETNTEIRGTRWAAYNSITEYVDHFSKVRSKGDHQLIRAERAITNPTWRQIKADAFDLFRVPEPAAA